MLSAKSGETGNGVMVQPYYAHPQQMKVLKHLVYVCHGCGMQFEKNYSLNYSVVAWFAHYITYDFSQLS
jgi:hypothetical protein